MRYGTELGRECVFHPIHNHFTTQCCCPSDQQCVPTRRVHEQKAKKNGGLETLFTMRAIDSEHVLDFVTLEHTSLQFHEIVHD